MEKIKHNENIAESVRPENRSDDRQKSDENNDENRTPFQDVIDGCFEIEPSKLKIMKVLGQGNFGDVSLGMLTKENARILVAVKTPKKREHYMEDDLEFEKLLQNQIESLRDELKIMCFIGFHENVLRLLGAITTHEDNFCVITEYCELGSLDIFLQTKIEKELFCNEIIRNIEGDDQGIAGVTTQWKSQEDSSWRDNLNLRRNNGQITTSDLLWFALQIARAMNFLTNRQVLHRDAALRNVLLKADYTVKVADFGLARVVSGDGSYCAVNSLVLPIFYIAPESLAIRHFSAQSEYWTFGVVLWELFTFAARTPYELECNKSEDYEVILEYLQSGHRLSIPDTAPLIVSNLMNQLWHGDPSKRPSFDYCETVLVNELMQACPEILQKPEDNIAPQKSDAIALGVLQTVSDTHLVHKSNWKSKLICIVGAVLLLLTAAIGILVARFLVISNGNRSSISETGFVRHFPGVIGALFCVHPNGESIFLFDSINFMRLNLTTEKYSVLKNIKILNNIIDLGHRFRRGSGYVRSNSILAVMRHSKLFILVLFFDVETTKFSLASYYTDMENISLVDVQDLGINQTTSFNFYNYALANSLIQDNTTGQLYCILYWDGSFVNAPSFARTFFRAVRIYIDRSGKISSEVVENEKKLHGRWMYPFVMSESLHFLDSIAIRRQKMVRISLKSNDTIVSENITLSAVDEQWPQWSTEYFIPFFPAILDDFIFYTADPSIEPGSILLNFVDWKQKGWRSLTIPFDLSGFLTQTFLNTALNADMKSTSDGRLIFHGGCNSEKPCTEKAYFFVIDVRQMLRNQTAISTSTNEEQQRSDLH